METSGISGALRGFVAALLALPLSASAAGIPVIDIGNLYQNARQTLESVAQTLKQIDQYKTQLKQYERQLKDGLAPDQYIWAEAKDTIAKLQATLDALEVYKGEMRDLETLLGQFHDLDHYRNSSCFQAGGCSAAELAKLAETERVGIASTKRASDTLLRGIDQQHEGLVADASTLQALQQKAKGASGQMEALGYSNQFASAQVNELMQIRTMLLAPQSLLAIQAQVQTDREAQAAAGAQEFRDGLEPNYRPRPGMKW